MLCVGWGLGLGLGTRTDFRIRHHKQNWKTHLLLGILDTPCRHMVENTPSWVDRKELKLGYLFWVAVKELDLSYYIGETLLFTIYSHYGNLI